MWDIWGSFLSLTPILDISTALMRPRRPKQYCLQLTINYVSFLGQHRSHVPVFSGMVHWYFPQQHRQCRCFRYTAKIIVYRHWFICPVQPVVMDRKLLTNFFLVCNLHISEKFSGHRLSCCLWNPYPSTLLFGEGLGLGLGLFYKPRTIIHVGVRIAQWWDHSLPIIVAWFKYVGWVFCSVLSLAPRVFSPVFPSTQKPAFPNSNSTRNGRRRTTMWMFYL